MSAPAVTVVVPTRGRPEALAGCLESVSRLTAPPGGFEVVVVDDGGKTSTSPPAGAWTDLRVLRVPQRGPAAARNAGARTARGEILAFTDDDCRPEPGWLVALVEAIERPGASAAGGSVVNVVEHDRWAEASAVLLQRLYAWYNAEPRDARFLASSNFAVKRSAFAELGGFDTTFPAAAAEDRDLCERLRESGARLIYVAEARVRHAHVLGPLGFWRQHIAYGRGAARFHARRAARTGQRLRAEPMRFYRLLLAGSPALAARIAIAQLANATGAALEWRHVSR